MVRLNHFKIYSKIEEESAKVASEKFKGEFRLYERCFNSCMEISDCISISTRSKPLGLESKTAVTLILTRIMQSMQAMKLLKTRGYNYDASILERSLVESMGLCAYISLNEKEAKRWLDGKQLEVASISLFEYIPRLLGHDERSKTARALPKRLYGRLCDYVHTNIKGVLYLVDTGQKTKNGGEVNLQFGPQFDEQAWGRIAAYPLLLILMLEKIFKNELGSNKKMKNKTKRLLKLFIDTEPKGTI